MQLNLSYLRPENFYSVFLSLARGNWRNAKTLTGVGALALGSLSYLVIYQWLPPELPTNNPTGPLPQIDFTAKVSDQCAALTKLCLDHAELKELCVNITSVPLPTDDFCVSQFTILSDILEFNNPLCYRELTEKDNQTARKLLGINESIIQGCQLAGSSLRESSSIYQKNNVVLSKHLHSQPLTGSEKRRICDLLQGSEGEEKLVVLVENIVNMLTNLKKAKEIDKKSERVLRDVAILLKFLRKETLDKYEETRLYQRLGNCTQIDPKQYQTMSEIDRLVKLDPKCFPNLALLNQPDVEDGPQPSCTQGNKIAKMLIAKYHPDKRSRLPSDVAPEKADLAYQNAQNAKIAFQLTCQKDV